MQSFLKTSVLVFFSILVTTFIFSCSVPPSPDTVSVFSFEIINSYPHNKNAFTQGLVFENGFLFEGTGLNGHSSLRKVALETGEVLQAHELPYEFFGEGITIYGDMIIQLTWRSNVGFVYDKETFEPLKEFYYPTEGWGITHNGKHLIMSDGTSALHFLDPETFQRSHTIEVHDNNTPISSLNELEYIKGKVYANVWHTDSIAIIAPQTGRVTGWIDLTGLLSPEWQSGSDDVLNGIAYDAKDDRLFVTGKRWPILFEIELIASD
jgi:glutamine cyclotransferase